MTRTRNYKTLSGLFRAAKRNEMSIEQIFGGRSIVVNYKVVTVKLSDEAKEQAAKIFSAYLGGTKSTQERIYNNLVNCSDGLDFFQCFYIGKRLADGSLFCSNSLSGEAFRYCKNMYLKKHC